MKIKRITLFIIIFIIIFFILIAGFLLKNVLNNSKGIASNELEPKENTSVEHYDLNNIYAVSFKNDDEIVVLFEDGTEKTVCSADSTEYTIKDFDNNNIYLSKLNNSNTEIYRIDLNDEYDSKFEYVTTLPSYGEYSKNNYFDNTRNFYENSFVVRENKIFYINKEDNNFYEYDTENDTNEIAVKKRANFFESGYMNKNNGYIYSSRFIQNLLNSKEGDISIIDVTERKSQREKQYAFELNEEEEENFEDYNSNEIIPIGNDIYCVYTNYYEKKYGLIKFDLEEKKIEYVLDFDDRFSFCFVYKEKIYFSKDGLYEFNTKTERLKKVSEGNRFEMNINYIINCLNYTPVVFDVMPEEGYKDIEPELLNGIDLKNDCQKIKKKEVPTKYTNIIYVK